MDSGDAVSNLIPKERVTMNIDECECSFEEVCSKRLPIYFSSLQASIAKPFPASWIREAGVGKATIIKRLERRADFSGCYLFIENGSPLYVGISRGVVGRLFQHLTSANHFSGSLAYYIAKRQNDPGGTRKENMSDSAFRALFENSQRRLEQCSIASVEINNSVELHLFEVYAAMELGTGELNTFRTH